MLALLFITDRNVVWSRIAQSSFQDESHQFAALVKPFTRTTMAAVGCNLEAEAVMIALDDEVLALAPSGKLYYC